MTRTERRRTLRMIRRELKGCAAFTMLLLPEPSQVTSQQARAVSLHMPADRQANNMLTYIGRMVLKGSLDLKLATKLVSNILSWLITRQQVETMDTADLQEVIKAAGVLPVGPPEKEGGSDE